MVNKDTTALAQYQAPTLAEMSQDFAALVALKSIMRRGTDYGKIPGCGDKDALFKPGAEKALKRFMVHVVDILVEDLSTADCIRYRVRCVGQTPDGITRGMGIGECSTDEEKYRWRKARNKPEWDDTMEDRRRVKHMQGRNGPYTIDQVRTNPADLANTVLKMGKKRSMVDLALTATAASEFFTQDLEDMSDEMRAQVGAEHAARPADPFTPPVVNTTAEPVPPKEPAPDPRGVHPKRQAWLVASELGLTGEDVADVLKAQGAPEDAATWTVAQVAQYCDALRAKAATPPVNWYERVQIKAQELSPDDWAKRLDVATVDAGHAETKLADYTEAIADKVVDEIEKGLGM